MRLGLLSFFLALPAFGARPFTPEELLLTRRLDDVQVSPDGRLAAFTVRQKSLAENRDVKDVWLIPTAGGTARQFTRDGRSEHARWSPDGKSLLVVATRNGETQLWLYDVAQGGDAQRLTSLWGGAEGGVFSPDGKLIAFTSDVYPACKGDALDGCNRDRADETEKSKVRARVVDHLFARHWSDWKDGKRTHLFVQPLWGGPARDVTPGDADWPGFRLGGNDDYAFAPDGQSLIVSAKPAQREAWSTNGDLWSVLGGAPRDLTAQNKGDDAQPRFSPDGRHLAWTAQAEDGNEADQWKLMLSDGKGAQPRVIGDLDDDVGTIVWRRDSKGLVASFTHFGRTYLASVGLDGKVVRFADDPAGADFDLAPDGAALFVGSAIDRPPELYRLAPGGKPQKLTSFNDAQYAGLELAHPADLWVEGKDGSKVHSWLLKPPGNARAPLLVLIHGGPQGSWHDEWSMRWNAAAFAARGYAVVTPDPHGSTGYGHAYEAEISGDWGGLAYDDILRSVDAAEKQPFVEPGHTCAAGASFGGYMVDWIAGHTDRFKCLVTHDGVFDLVSMYGSTEELWFPEHEFGGPYWEKPEQYRKWSPSAFAQNFKTPTLVVQGELDFRVPVEQGLGMFSALQRRGVESKMLWFPDEGHWVLKPRNSQLWYHTVLDWMDAHAKPRGGGPGAGR